MIGSPGKIENEIIVEKTEGDFTLTENFLEYKKEILKLLGI